MQIFLFDDYKNIINFFLHVIMKHKVQMLLDPCHLLKLARNAIADYGEFKSKDQFIGYSYIGFIIFQYKWKYITQL